MNKPKYKSIPLHATKVFQGIRWEVYQWEQELFDGSLRTFESVKRFDIVTIYPVIDNTVVINEEEQPHWGKPSDTVVAGGIDVDEDPETAARRELFEETGMIFKDMYLVDVSNNSGDAHWHSYTYIAKNLLEVKDVQESSGEKTKPKRVTFDELITLARERKFHHKPTFVDEFIIRDKIDTLFDIFKNPEKHSIQI